MTYGRQAPTKGLRFAADRIGRKHAAELRAAVAAGGTAMLLAGVIASVDALLRGSIDAEWSALVAFGGLILAVRASRAPRPLRNGGLKQDLVLLGVALLLDGILETLHAAGVLAAGGFHLVFAAGLGLGAAILATVSGRRFPLEARVIAAVRLAAFFLVVAAATRFLALGMGDPHGRIAGLSMTLFAAAGFLLARTATRTPAVAWQRL